MTTILPTTTKTIIGSLLRQANNKFSSSSSSSSSNTGLLNRKKVIQMNNGTGYSTTAANGVKAKPAPLVIFCGGSFNPITNMHLRMFELARDHFKLKSDQFSLMEAVVSPVSDAYKKKGLVEANHRCEMTLLAVDDSDWIKLSRWEADKPDWTRTIEALRYHRDLYARAYGDDNLRLMLLCGGDLLESFALPDIWKEQDINDIVSEFGIAVITRAGSNPEKFIYETDVLYRNRKNIELITNWIPNEISSTKIRRAVSRNESIKYLVPDKVAEYIQKHGLYKSAPSSHSSASSASLSSLS